MFYLCSLTPCKASTDQFGRPFVKAVGPTEYFQGNILHHDQRYCAQEARKKAADKYGELHPDLADLVKEKVDDFCQIVFWTNPSIESMTAEMAKTNPGGAETIRRTLPNAIKLQHGPAPVGGYY